VTETQRQDVIDNVAEIARPLRLKRGEFTIRHYAEVRNLSHKAASGELERLRRAGRLTRRKVLHKRNWQWAYKPKPDTPPAVCDEGANCPS